MAHDVFISYSSIDKATADAACATFEQHGIRCWMAPRDVPAGSEWAEAIIDAIEHAIVMVLIFSTHSNESRQVRREIELAVSRGLTIMPIRLEKLEPTKSMAYYMAGVHWLDALTPPLEQHFRQMVDWITPLLRVNAEAAPKPPPRPKPTTAAPPPQGKAGTTALTPDDAQRIFDEANKLGAAGRRADAVAAYRALVTRIGEPADGPMRQKLAMTLHSLALNLEQLGEYAEAVTVYDDLLRRYRQKPDSILTGRMAMVLVDRGNPLNQLGRPRDALASYDELATLFGSSSEPGVVEQLARSGVCRGIVLDEMSRHKEAVAAYDSVIRRFGTSADPSVLEKVAVSIYNRALILADNLARKRDAIAGFEYLVRRFSSNPDAKLQRQVELARNCIAKLG